MLPTVNISTLTLFQASTTEMLDLSEYISHP